MTQLLALLLTLALEVPCALMLRRWSATPLPPLKFAAVAASTSLLTHPVVWPLVTAWLTPSPFWLRAAIAEPIAVAVEAILYAKLARVSPARAFVVALAANTVSFFVGMLIGGRLYNAAAVVNAFWRGMVGS